MLDIKNTIIELWKVYRSALKVIYVNSKTRVKDEGGKKSIEDTNDKRQYSGEMSILIKLL